MRLMSLMRISDPLALQAASSRTKRSSNREKY